MELDRRLHQGRSGPPDVGFAVALAWLLLVGAAAATVPQVAKTTIQGFSSTTYTRVDGLPQNGVTTLTNTPDGFLWVGTQAGLSRFDGVSFTNFDERNNPVFKDHFVTSLVHDPAGNLWVGTRQGLVRRSIDGSWIRLSTDDSLGSDYVRSLSLVEDGSLMIGTYGAGLNRWTGTAVEVVSDSTIRLADGLVRAILEDSSGSLWVATASALQRVRNGALTTFSAEHGLTGDFVRSLAEGTDGELWVGTEGGGLLRYRAGIFESYSERIGLDPRSTVWALLVDRRGDLWVGTQERGVRRLRFDGYDSITAGFGLASDMIWSLHEDAEGSIWIGTRGGLTQLKPSRIRAMTTDDGLIDDRIRTVVQDSQGLVWIGSEGGLDCIEFTGSGVSLVARYLAGRQVRSLARGADGAMWVGTQNGLFRVFQGRVAAPDFAASLSEFEINAMAVDSDGCLWVGTGEGGLVRWCGGDLERIAQGLPTTVIRAIDVTTDGTVWVGTEAGLACLRNGTTTLFSTAHGLPSSFVYAIHEDAAGGLWLGTSEGLVLYRHDRFTTFGTGRGLPVGLVFQILEDDEETLWLSTQQGLVSVAKSELLSTIDRDDAVIRYSWADESDGMPSSECNGATQPAGWRTDEGYLLFPTFRGLAIVDYRQASLEITPPIAVIDSFNADGREVTLGGRIELAPGTSEIELGFTAPTFVAPLKTRFKYHLEGYHEHWIEIGNRRNAHFANLDPGRYRFRLTASNENGIWSAREAAVEFEIEPHLWQRTWFLVLAGAVFLATGPAIYRYRLLSIRRRQRELESVVARRTAELAEANRKLEQLATVDELTNLANHRQFRAVLKSEWHRHQRSFSPLSILMIDVDHFKLFNDCYGHLAGDRALRSVAEALGNCANRPGDLAARYGGEEFAVLLSETGVGGAQEIAERIRISIANAAVEHSRSPVADHVTVSIGVATIVPSGAAGPDTLVGAADDALYEAKRAGRDRVAVSSVE